MPRSRKRHHSHSKSRSRSRSRSRSPYSRDRDYSCDRHREREEKDGKRRKVDALESPQNRSLSPTNDVQAIQEEDQRVQDVADVLTTKMEEKTIEKSVQNVGTDCESEDKQGFKGWDKNSQGAQLNLEEERKLENKAQSEQTSEDKIPNNSNDKAFEDIVELSDSDTGSLDTSKVESSIDTPKKEKLSESAKKEKRASLCSKPLTPKQMQKRVESEKRRQEKLKEKEDKLKQKQEEKAKILEEKLKQKQQKDDEKQKQLEEKKKQLEQKQKEKELKEEQRKKEKEEKERKRKEKEELEEQKRKEKEMEKLKKQLEIEEKEKEKQKEEEKKQKSAKILLSFIKKSDNVQPEEKKTEKNVASKNQNFMPFEVKSDMKLPLLRREPLTDFDILNLDRFIQNQNDNESYLKELKNGKEVGKCEKTWPVEDDGEDEDVMVVEDKKLGETICEDTSTVKKMRAKFLSFHENRRPPYFGTWRKKSKFVKARKPLGEDTKLFNYEEDSDDDWEEEEQGESLDQSDGEQDKETEEEKDDYEVDNEFFVPHGHLSDDEINDEENARLSPESMKQKLKLLKDEFEEDIKSKTHKLKPRSIGCVWFNKAGDNVEEAIQRYLQPFAALVNGQVEIKKRSEIFNNERKKVKFIQELPQDHIPLFLNIIHGNPHNQKALVEQFLTYMTNNEMQVEISKTHLIRYLKKSATYKKWKEPGLMKNKSAWFLNEDIREKYNITITDKGDKIE